MTGFVGGVGRPGEESGRFLVESGALSSDWLRVFAAVPRSAFLPEVVWAHDMESGRNVAVGRVEDPAGWERVAYADVPVITQWDDGRRTGAVEGGVPASSASMPSVVAGMLRDLDAGPGVRVLEIGTGTGWNAGLLAYRLGDENVTSIEVDRQVVDRARVALADAGLHPEVVHGDGALGHAASAPYDRVVATAGVRSVPSAWLAQCRPGGVILAPWGSYYSHQEALVGLTVAGDGSASGPFLRFVEFMTLRDQRLDWTRFAGYVPPAYEKTAGEPAGTTLTAADLGDRYTPQLFVTGLCVPRCAHVVNGLRGAVRAWFFDLDSVSWAAAEFRDGEPVSRVWQAGPRRLWDEVAGALAWWTGRGSPGLERFGLTVTPDGAQRPWLDSPANPVPTMCSPAT